MKSIKAKIVLFVTAVLLAITAMGSLITAYATGKQEIDPQGSMVYSEEMEVTADGSFYELTLKMEAKVSVASFNFGLRMPEFVKVTEVVVAPELARWNNAHFEYDVIEGGTLVYVSFTSAENVMGSFDLIIIRFQALGNGSGAPEFYDNIMFANTDYEYFTYLGTAFGRINSYGAEENETLKGDANLDGYVSLSDLVMMQRHLVNIRTEYLVGQSFTNADIDNSGIIDTIDCQYMQMFLVGQLESLEGIGGGNGGEINPPVEDDKTYFKINIYVVDPDGTKLAEFDTQMFDREYIFEHLYNKTNLGQFNILGAYYDEAHRIPVGDVETIKGPTRLYVVVENYVPQETTLLKVYFMLRNEYGKTEQYNYMEMEVAIGSEVGPHVEGVMNSQPYQLEIMSGDRYGNIELPYGRIIWDETEVYLIYAQKEPVQPEQNQYEVEVVICNQQGGVIHTEYVKVYENAQIWEVTSRTDVYMYGVQGVYYDAERINPANDSDTIKGDTTIYVVSPDYKYIPKVTVTVYLVTEDGESLTNTIDENVRENQTVWSAMGGYSNYPGYRFARFAYDPEGKRLVPGSAVVSDGLEVYAIMEKGETEYYALRVNYMLVSGDKIVEMGWQGSDGTMGNIPLASFGVGEEHGYQKAGVYYDAQLTEPVGEYDVLNKDTEVYVKMLAPEMSGTYDLYGVVIDDKYGPMPGTEIIGSVTFEGDVLILNTERLDNVGGQYVDLGGMYQAMLGDQDYVMVMVQGGSAYLYYEFYGSDYEFEPSVQEVVGHYEFEADGDDYVLDLYENAVFSMNMYGTTMFGNYTYDAETHEIVLNVMGDSAYCIYDPETKTVTPVMDDNDGPSEYPDYPSLEDYYGRTFYAPCEDAQGNQVQHELGCDEFGWFLVLEPSYAEKLGLEGYAFNATEVCLFNGYSLNFFIEEYKVFNITLHPEWEGFSIYRFVDLSQEGYNETCAKYAGKYQLVFEGETSTVELYDNGVAVVFMVQGRDIAKFYEVEEGVLSIGDRERVIVSGDMLIIEETEDESGKENGSTSNGQVQIPGTVFTWENNLLERISDTEWQLRVDEEIYKSNEVYVGMGADGEYMITYFVSDLEVFHIRVNAREKSFMIEDHMNFNGFPEDPNYVGIAGEYTLVFNEYMSVDVVLLDNGVMIMYYNGERDLSQLTYTGNSNIHEMRNGGHVTVDMHTGIIAPVRTTTGGNVQYN